MLSIFGAGVIKNEVIVSTGTAGATSLWNPDWTEVPAENLAPKRAAPGTVSPGKFCTGAAQWEREVSGLGVFKWRNAPLSSNWISPSEHSGCLPERLGFPLGKMNHEELTGILQCPVKTPGWVWQNHVWLHKDTELYNGRHLLGPVAQIILLTVFLIGPPECLWCDKDITAADLFSV